MTQNEFQQMLVGLMTKGLRIEMFIEDGKSWFDMATGMKSHLHLTYNEPAQTTEYRGRYDVKGTITDTEDLMLAVRDCLCGRDFMSYVWADILKGAT